MLACVVVVQLAMTSLAVQGAFWFMPNVKVDQDAPILQVLKRFAVAWDRSQFACM